MATQLSKEFKDFGLCSLEVIIICAHTNYNVTSVHSDLLSVLETNPFVFHPFIVSCDNMIPSTQLFSVFTHCPLMQLMSQEPL